MAVYTTIADLQKRLDPEVLAGLADDENSPPDLDDPQTQTVLTQAIADGAQLIDSYLLGRVELSDPAVQAALERINATLALYYLYRRRYVDDAHNPLSAAREAVSAHLQAVASGAAKLGADGDEQPELSASSTTADIERALDTQALTRF